MLVLNGRKFAKNNSELVNTLFDPSGTACGMYRKRKDGVLLIGLHDNKPFAYIRNDGLVISCSQEGKQIWYMFALTSQHTKLLGFDMLPYSKHNIVAREAIEQEI